jgi:hypothetical protein
MFIPDSEAIFYVDLYSKFLSAFSSFHMYCIGKLGKERSNYNVYFLELKEAYDRLFRPTEDLSERKWCNEATWNLMADIEHTLDKETFADDDVSEITKWLTEFKEKHLKDFQFDILKFRFRHDAELHYPKKLIGFTYELLEAEEYESAVLASFKYLDSHLQSTLDLDPNKYYGEDLINYAFSSSSGALRFSGHPNEQAGIRNIFSGANAIFRNPLAHKLISLEERTAESIIIMVKLMADLVTKIHRNNSDDRKNLEYY